MAQADAWRRPPPVAALFSGGRAPVTVGPTPSDLRGVDADDCAQCHADIADEWRASLHAQAWRDPIFLAAYAVEPAPFCRHCHAPLHAPGASTPGARARREGVSCAVCHVRDGHVLGTGSGRGDASPAQGTHALTASPVMALGDVCGGCHQFDFPTAATARGERPAPSGEPMQNTLGEWMRSALRDRACQHCHMPLRTTADGRRYRSHRFDVLADPAQRSLAARVAVTLDATPAATVVEAVVTPGEVGHAVPTGDLLRRLELSVWLDGDPASMRVETFARRFTATAAHRRTGAVDTRVPPPGTGSRRVRFELPPAPLGTTVRWRLDHLRTDPATAHAQRLDDAQIRVTLLTGAARSQGSRSTVTRTTPSD